MNERDPIEEALQQSVDAVKRHRGRLKAELSLKDSDLSILHDKLERTERERDEWRRRYEGVAGVVDELAEVLHRAKDARAASPNDGAQVGREAVRAEFAGGTETSADIGRALRAIAGTGQGASPG